MKERTVVSVDLGGTNIRLGIVDAGGRILRRRRVRMFDAKTKAGLYGALSDLIMSFIESGAPAASPKGVGVGFAGPTRAKDGFVYFSPNIGQLSDLDIGRRLESRLGIPVLIQNDANCAALGEYWCGAGQGAASLFLFTLGTGVGGSLIIDGKLWEGSHGIAGEIGHTVIDMNGPRCRCGSRGCLETLASATAMIRGYTRRGGGRTGSEVENLTAKAIAEMAKRGDSVARDVVLSAAKALGIGIANVFNLINPELILIGGGVSRAGSILIAPAVRHARSAIFGPLRDGLKVRRARLGDAAALIGAAYLAHMNLAPKKPGVRS